MLKKIFIGVGGFIIVLIVVLSLAPLMFKNEIKLAIDEQLEANVNADVRYDIDNFSVSFFSNFPNLTAGITDLGVVGREPFEGTVLFEVNEFEIELNIWKLLSSEMSVQGIYLDRPRIHIKVLEDGTANYDIAISSEDEIDETSSESEDFNIAIEHWSIKDGHITYDDATIPTYVDFTDFNHSGNGNFSLSVFDLKTSTSAFIEQLSYDGVNYLSKRSVNLDLVLLMDLDQMKFTFRENELAVNDFAFGFDGWVAMPGDDIDMDLTFSSRKNSFKSLISLIPAIYAEDFESLETSGELDFNGAVKGTYNDNSLPAYAINLNVSDGMFHYPDLPEAVQNVQIAINIACADGNVDNTSIDISKMHLEFGREPVDGFMKIGNLVSYPIELELNTAVNVANLNHLIPMEGLDVQGLFEAHIKASGKYDSITNEMPKVDAVLSYTNGAINYADIGAPIDKINMQAAMVNSSGKLDDTKIEVSEFGMELDGNPIVGELLIENLDNIHWRAMLNGDLNFDKLFPVISRIYPLPGTTLSGDILAQVKSEGTMSDLEKENYSALSTSGTAIFTDFVYSDSLYLPQGFEITSGEMSFDPIKIKVNNLDTKVGSSDFTFNGNLSNYIPYLFQNETVQGNFAMKSSYINVDEFMVDSEDDMVDTVASEYSVIEVPTEIDFVFKASIGEIKYDNLKLNDARGEIVVRDGELRMNDLFTKTLGGAITFDGKYSTRDIENPVFDMKLDVKDINIGESYSAFNMVKAFAPIARDMSGDVSTLFAFSGVLKQDMMPDMASLNGQGKVFIADASLSDSKVVSGLTNFIKGGEQSLTLKDIAMNVRISDGRLQVDPFDMKLNNANTNIGGSTGLDGSIDYKIQMDVPAGQLGNQVNTLLGSLTGSANDSENIKLNIGVGGSYLDPKFNLLGSTAKTEITKVASEKAADIVKESTGVEVPVTKEELNEEAVKRAREEADKILADAQEKADLVKSEAQKRAEQVREEADQQSEKLIKDAGSNIIKKKAAEIAAKKVKEEAYKQADNIEAEANKQADTIMSKAQEKADSIIDNAKG